MVNKGRASGRSSEMSVKIKDAIYFCVYLGSAVIGNLNSPFIFADIRESAIDNDTITKADDSG